MKVCDQQTQTEHPHDYVNGDGLRVLVIEDNPDTAASLATLLTMQGHDVEIALDGPTGLGLARQASPDVILLDIGLPGLDGHLVAQSLGEHPAFKKPLLIAITGYGQDSDRRRSAEVGIDLHLVKPVDPVLLRDLLSRFRTIVR